MIDSTPTPYADWLEKKPPSVLSDMSFEDKEEVVFPSQLSSGERKAVHNIADALVSSSPVPKIYFVHD